jgi:UPF0755 protein
MDSKATSNGDEDRQALAASLSVALRRGRRRRLFVALMLCFIIAVGVPTGGLWWIVRWAARAQGPVGEQRLTIKPGTATREIARELERRGLISNHRIWLAWLALSGNRGKLQAGDYRIEGPIAPAALAATLRRGAFERALTIPEGWTARQIAERLKAQGWIAREEDWLALVARPLPAETLGEAMPQGAEGFCFPETYRFEQGTPPEAILKRMLEEFARQWKAARPEERAPISREPTMFQVATLAAMVEREARLPEEMPRIAAVYLNRLRRGMKLQCCATVYHALGDGEAWERPLTYADLKIDNPYNTYRYGGLPPGPIANPGRPAIEAVLRPAATGELFYVYRGDRRHVFSRTFKEHQAAVLSVRRSNPQAGVVQQGPD